MEPLFHHDPDKLDQESKWEWADPALAPAPWPQGQYVRPRAGPFHQNFVAPLTHWVHEADPEFSKCLHSPEDYRFFEPNVCTVQHLWPRQITNKSPKNRCQQMCTQYKIKRLQVSKNVKLMTSIQQTQTRSKYYRFNMLNFSHPVGYRES